jgi:hypothetical protein
MREVYVQGEWRKGTALFEAGKCLTRQYERKQVDQICGRQEFLEYLEGSGYGDMLKCIPNIFGHPDPTACRKRKVFGESQGMPGSQPRSKTKSVRIQ